MLINKKFSIFDPIVPSYFKLQLDSSDGLPMSDIFDLPPSIRIFYRQRFINRNSNAKIKIHTNECTLNKVYKDQYVS